MNALRTTPARPRGVAMIETVIFLVMLVTMFLATIDLGVALYRRSIVEQVAREVARRASVHGEMAGPFKGQWGPESITTSAAASDPVAEEIRPFLSGLDEASTTILLEYPDGDVKPESLVRATVTTTHQPFMVQLFGSGPWTFTATATVQINH